MDMGFLDTFLSDKEVEVPSGGDFTPSGLIGSKWVGAVLNRVGWTEVDLAETNPEIKFNHRSVSGGGKYRYYIQDSEMAAAAQEAIGSDYKPEVVWNMSVASGDILNFANDDIKAAFGDGPSFDVVIKTPKSAKYRHEFQLITLPYMVQAIAIAAGILKDRVFNANELLDGTRDFSDEFQRTMIGDPDGKSAEAMLDSELGARRTALWVALGENNPLAYLPIGKTGKYAATNETFSQLLGIYSRAWKAPLPAEVVSFYDPRVDAHWTDTSGEEKRQRVSAFTRFFADAEEARVEANRQLTERASRDSSDGEPELPSEWAGYKDMFIENFKNNVPGNPVAMIASKMSMTPQEVEKWKVYLGL